MKFTVNSKQLLQRLVTLATAQDSKNALPILDCVKFTLNESSLTLTAGNTDHKVTTSLAVENTSDTGQKICIPSATVISFLKEVPDQPVEITANDQTYEVTITYQGGKAQFVGQDASVYPEPDTMQGSTFDFTIPASVISDGLRAAAPFIANDELRPQMCGVFFDFLSDKSQLVLAASDGHKLCRYTFDNIASAENRSFIMPARLIAILNRLAGSIQSDITLTTTETQVIIRIGEEYTINSRLIEGRFPNYNSVIPKDSPIHVHVDSSLFSQALRRILVFASAASGLIRFNITEDHITIEGQDLDFSTSGSESVPCESNGTLKIGFNGIMMLDLLKTLPPTEINLRLTSESVAGVFTPQEQSEGADLLMLLMPMMLTE